MRNKHIQVLGLTIIGSSILFAACISEEAPQDQLPSDPWGFVSVQSGAPIRIGLSLNLSDPLMGQEAVEMERGAQMAVDEFGSMTGKEVDLVVIDTPCSFEGGESAAQQLASDTSFAGMIGPSCRTACLGAAEVIAPTHLTAISGTCGPGELFQAASDSSILFRTIYSDAAEGELAAQFAFSELAARRAIIVQYASGESAGFSTGFRTRMEALGGQIIDVIEVQPGTALFRVTLDTISLLRPDVVYLALLPADSVEFIAIKSETQVADMPLIATRFARSSWFAQEVDSSGVGTYATGPNLDAAKLGTAEEAYRTKFGSEPTSALFAYTYDAVHLLLEGIHAAGISTANGEYIIGRRALSDAVRNTAALDGVTGELTCTPLGDCSVASIGVSRLDETGWTIVFVR